MRRRSFLAAIAAAFVAPDPEKLLWQPGKKLISIPAPPRIALPVPIAWQAITEDITSLTDQWRRFEVTGYLVEFSDGSLARLSPREIGTIRVLTANELALATRRPPLRRFP